MGMQWYQSFQELRYTSKIKRPVLNWKNVHIVDLVIRTHARGLLMHYSQTPHRPPGGSSNLALVGLLTLDVYFMVSHIEPIKSGPLGGIWLSPAPHFFAFPFQKSKLNLSALVNLPLSKRILEIVSFKQECMYVCHQTTLIKNVYQSKTCALCSFF